MRTENEKIELCKKFLEKRGYLTMPKFMNINDVASLFGVSSPTARGFPIKRLEIQRAGRRPTYRFEARDVHEFYKSCEKSGDGSNS